MERRGYRRRLDNVLDQYLEPFGLEKRDTGDINSSDLSSAQVTRPPDGDLSA
jgi:hypothetical protein